MRIKHVKNQNTIDKYWNLYTEAVKNQESPGIILRIAKLFDICPCLIAKLIVQKYFEINDNPSEIVQLNNYMRDTSLIPDMDLAYEVFLVSTY